MIEVQMVILRSKLKNFEAYLEEINGKITMYFPRGNWYITKIDIPKHKRDEVLDKQLELLDD